MEVCIAECSEDPNPRSGGKLKQNRLNNKGCNTKSNSSKHNDDNKINSNSSNTTNCKEKKKVVACFRGVFEGCLYGSGLWAQG